MTHSDHGFSNDCAVCRARLRLYVHKRVSAIVEEEHVKVMNQLAHEILARPVLPPPEWPSLQP